MAFPSSRQGGFSDAQKAAKEIAKSHRKIGQQAGKDARKTTKNISHNRGPGRRDTNVIFEKLHDFLPPNHHQRRKPRKTHTSKHLARSQAAHPEVHPIITPAMLHVQSPSSPGEYNRRSSLASTIFFSATSKLHFSSSRSPRRLSSSSDNSVIARSMKGFRFPSVVDDRTKPLHRIGQAPNLNELPPVFIPNGDGLMAGFTYHSDSRSSVEKARSRRWGEWRCKMKNMPGRVGRKMKRVGRQLRRSIKDGFRF
ncbi:hypothetical protein B0T18DRAFT_429414 [Schizothecium vesticola]|uniref:Uncharacterized protein n=1 Tax=Schizothecium vesticola TaxID=314040 RepID=A0AA40EVR5_9PEZI|nr:hypothetical protein B0T18DRAFT_429414 [Schizothecium vesticola]